MQAWFPLLPPLFPISPSSCLPLLISLSFSFPISPLPTSISSLPPSLFCSLFLFPLFPFLFPPFFYLIGFYKMQSVCELVRFLAHIPENWECLKLSDCIPLLLPFHSRFHPNCLISFVPSVALSFDIPLLYI